MIATQNPEIAKVCVKGIASMLSSGVSAPIDPVSKGTITQVPIAGDKAKRKVTLDNFEIVRKRVSGRVAQRKFKRMAA